MQAAQEITGMSWHRSLHAGNSWLVGFLLCSGKEEMAENAKVKGRLAIKWLRQIVPVQTDFCLALCTGGEVLDPLAQVRCLIVSHGVLRAKLVRYELEKRKGQRKLVSSLGSVSCDPQYEVWTVIRDKYRGQYY